MDYPSTVTTAPTSSPGEALRAPRRFADLVAPDLALVEEELARNFKSTVRTIEEVGEHILTGGGKRIRPTLLLLSSYVIGYDQLARIRYAAVIELIHTATLVHDDVIDAADKRRGRESINFRWGNHLTVLVGDFLYTHAMKSALLEGSLEAVDLLCDTTIRMTEGEILGLEMKGRTDVTEKEYFDLIGRKTASLFSAGCFLPALLAGADEREAEALREYGLNLGICFQLVDDLLDFTSNERVLGKPSLADLKDGKLTLPLILSMEEATTAERERISRIATEGSLLPDDEEAILDIARRLGGISRTRKIARDYAERALSATSVFPDSTAREALEYAVEFVLDRDR